MFRFGCWSTIGASVAYLAGHVLGRRSPANDTERQLLDLASTYAFTLADGRSRTLMNAIEGFSLDVVVLLAVVGALGLVVARRGAGDPRLMWAVARASALGSVVLLVIALTKFSVLSAVPMAVMATCFLVASVEAPAVE
jgi:hypothetical protein